MGDNPATASTSPQRKLPNPVNSANTNSNLKGILIKPKRILPAQPDCQKLKKSVQENTLECKSDENLNETSQATLNSCAKNENAIKDIAHKVTIPKLQIDVERLKTHFQLSNGKSVVRNIKRNTDLNENDLFDSESDRKAPVRTVNECTNPNVSTGLSKESSLYGYNSDGLTKVREWCSAGEIGKMTAKIATDPVGKSIDRSIRSPSPKSNTTWDRSSSGYSSDERADPRSPPPNHSANISISSKTETEVTNDDDISVTNTAETSEQQDDDNDIEPDNDNGTNDDTDFNNTLTNNNEQSATLKSELCDSPTTLTDKDESSSSPSSTTSEETDLKNNTGAKCDSCDANQEKIDSTNSCVNLNFDNSASAKQNTKRPAWTAHSTLPGNGRVIQYRKSGSESTISLRHSSRHGSFENNFDGLEVCGKSFPQSASSNSIKNDSSVPDSDTGGRQEISSPSSAFVPVSRQLPDTEIESPRIEPKCLELPTRAHFLRPQITPRGLGPNGKILYFFFCLFSCLM